MTGEFEPRTKQMAYIEYIEETAFGSGIPLNGDMQWANSITKFDPGEKNKTESKMYLGSSETTNPSMNFRHAKIGEEVGCSIEAMVQTGYLMPNLKYFLGGTNALPLQLSDKLTTTSIVNIDTSGVDKCVHVYEGSIATETTLSVPEFGSINMKSKYTSKNLRDLTIAEYEDATRLNIAGVTLNGSHAIDTDARVLQAEDINNIYMRPTEDTPTAWGSATRCGDAMKELELKVVNKLGLPTDLNETTSTRIRGNVLLSRALTFNPTVTYDNISKTSSENSFTLENIRSLKPFDFRFDLDSYRFTLYGVQYPELKRSYGGEDMIGDKLESMQIKGAREDGVYYPPLVISAVV